MSRGRDGKVIRIGTDMSSILDPSIRSLVALHRAIIYQALIDLTLEPPSRRAEEPRRDAYRREAAAWFRKDRRTFLDTCDCALIPAESVLELVARINAGEHWEAP